MQDFTQCNYKITLDGIRKATEAGQHVTVIINGEYYDLTPDDDHNEKEQNRETLLKIIESYYRMSERGKEYPAATLDDIRHSTRAVLKQNGITV